MNYDPEIKNLIREKQEEYNDLIPEHLRIENLPEVITPEIQMSLMQAEELAKYKMAEKYGYIVNSEEEDEEDF